ncbi:Uncharacterised protein [Bordetella pertussis]|nr:Uncharacterised protein [Bordetella pertussis]
MTPAHLAASASTWLHLPPGVVAAALAGQIQMFGVPAEVRVFHAPQGIDALLAHFATRHAELRDLTVLPGLAVLAGGAGDCCAWMLLPVTGQSRWRSRSGIGVPPGRP